MVKGVQIMMNRMTIVHKLLAIISITDSGKKSYILSDIPGAVDALRAAKELLSQKENTVDIGWPKNILLDIGVIATDEEASSVEENLLCAIDKLNRNEKMTLLRYYKDQISLIKIGKELGLSSERARVLKAKAIKYLKRSELINLICNGADAVDTYENIRRKYIKETNNLKDNLNRVKIINAVKETTVGELRHVMDVSVYDKDIDSMGLSTRARNILKRYKGTLSKIGDLKGITRNDLLMIRNSGKKSVNEIVEKAAEYGIKIN